MYLAKMPSRMSAMVETLCILWEGHPLPSLRRGQASALLLILANTRGGKTYLFFFFFFE